MCDCLLIEKGPHRTRSLADARLLVSIPRMMWTRFVRENSAKLLSRRPADSAKNTYEVHRPYTITVDSSMHVYTTRTQPSLSSSSPAHATLSSRAESAASDGPRPVSLCSHLSNKYATCSREVDPFVAVRLTTGICLSLRLIRAITGFPEY